LFASQESRFPAIRPDNVSFHPDAHLSILQAIWTTYHKVRTPDRLKHHPSGRSGFPSRRCGFLSGRLSVFDQALNSFQNQIWKDCCNRPDDVDSGSDACQHGSDVHSTDMKIACRRSTVWTCEALIRKILAADVRPSGRQCLTIQTRLSNRKDF
jgi:hypothetical protein